MEHALDIVDKLAKELKSLQPISPENKRKLDRKFRLEFNYNSNHLEGNTLTYGETELLLIFDDTRGNHTMREYEEMKAHDVAYQFVEEMANDNEHPLTEQNIKNLNKIILVRPFWKDAITPDGQPTKRLIEIGNYKEFPNSVRLANGEIFDYSLPAETPALMQELIEWYRSEEGALHPVTLASMLHYKFVRIHPFDDGNGRIARLLLNYVLLKNELPPVVIKTADKGGYLQALHDADTENYASFISYVAEQLIWSLELSIKAAKGENIEEDGDFKKKLALLKQEFEVEGKENEIIGLSAGVLKTALDEWVYSLLRELSKTTIEFNHFYDKPNHSISFDIEGVNTWMKVNDEISFNEVEDKLMSIDPDRRIQSGAIRFDCAFGAYKKGGLKPFGCNYNLEIKFSEYNYEVQLGLFEQGNQGWKLGKVKKSPLNKFLSTDEIKEINRLWGDSLLQHLEYNMKQIKLG
jgi:Fic family protein